MDLKIVSSLWRKFTPCDKMKINVQKAKTMNVRQNINADNTNIEKTHRVKVFKVKKDRLYLE